MKKLAILAVLILCAVGADARSHRRSSKYNAAGAPGAFDYYVLSLSWAPDFCDQSGQMNNRECGTGNHVGFIVHGLWPQFNNGGFPKQCAPASPVASDIVNRMLPIMMDAGLIQHEWRDHGTCSGLSPSAYFDSIRQVFGTVRVPDTYKTLSKEIQVNPPDVEAAFRAANPGVPATAYRVACSGGELNEVRICYGKDLKPQACSVNQKECTSGPLRMLPLR